MSVKDDLRLLEELVEGMPPCSVQSRTGIGFDIVPDDMQETYRAALDRVRDALTVLVDARDLAVAVADKNIGELSERAREVQRQANNALGDLPSAEDVAGILAAARSGREA